jgi:hypothetical protein
MQRAIILVLLILSNTSLFADTKIKKVGNKLWKVSVSVLLASQFADIATSYNGPERNNFLASSNGRFGTKGIAIKSAVVGGMVLGQYLMLRKIPNTTPFIIGNFAMAGVTSVVAIKNYRLIVKERLP